MSTFVDHYAILGVKPTANPAVIKKAYRQLALQHHPDKATSGGKHDATKFISAVAAYEVLIDVSKRKAYDIQYKKRSKTARSSRTAHKQATRATQFSQPETGGSYGGQFWSHPAGSDEQINIEEDYNAYHTSKHVDSFDRFGIYTKEFDATTKPYQFPNDFAGDSKPFQFQFPNDFAGDSKPFQFQFPDHFAEDSKPFQFQFPDHFAEDSKPFQFQFPDHFAEDSKPFQFQFPDHFAENSSPAQGCRNERDAESGGLRDDENSAPRISHPVTEAFDLFNSTSKPHFLEEKVMGRYYKDALNELHLQKTECDKIDARLVDIDTRLRRGVGDMPAGSIKPEEWEEAMTRRLDAAHRAVRDIRLATESSLLCMRVERRPRLWRHGNKDTRGIINTMEKNARHIEQMKMVLSGLEEIVIKMERWTNSNLGELKGYLRSFMFELRDFSKITSRP